tara:strand:- start:29 stop:700 length:672 start_codon:yes stop_codon:yes gene_type:complete
MPIQQMLLGGGGGLTEVTESLSGSGTWTAPAGVTSVQLVMSGSGSLPEQWANQNTQISFNWTSSTSPSQTSCNAAISSWWSAYSGSFGATAQRTLCGPTNHSYTLDNGDTVNVRETMNYYNSTCHTVRYAAAAPSGNATMNINGKWCFMYRSGIQRQFPGVAGQSSTMFGYTATGAPVGGSAGTVNQTVSVTPGTGYSYTRGYILRHNPYGSSSGSLVLTYYQ